MMGKVRWSKLYRKENQRFGGILWVKRIRKLIRRERKKEERQDVIEVGAEVSS